MTKSFHAQLDGVRHELTLLAATVTELIPRGTEVLLSGDLEDADAILQGDDEIDARSVHLEEQCFQLLATQQPMASDLRELITAIHMIGEVERSADLVANICKAARRIYGQPLEPKIRGLIAKMSDAAHQLYLRAVDAYVEHDAPLAAALDDMDDGLDELHGALIQAIFEQHAGEKLDLQTAVQLAVVARFYERIGDHAVNIGERVRFMVTGWLPEHTGAARAEVRQRQVEESQSDDHGDGSHSDAGLGQLTQERPA